MAEKYVTRQRYLKKRNLRGFFAGATSAYVRRKLRRRLFLLKIAHGLDRVGPSAAPDDVANDRRIAVVLLKPIDKGIEILVTAPVVDAMLQSERRRDDGRGSVVCQKLKRSRVDQKIGAKRYRTSSDRDDS